MLSARETPTGTAKEDRDYLLDYKLINIHGLGKADLLDVSVDNVTRDEAVALVLNLIENKRGPHHILFLDPLKLMRIRKSKKFSYIKEQADMILPDGAGLQWASAKLGVPLKERVPMIPLLMDVVRLATQKEFTIYMLGSKIDYLDKVFFNLQRSFPGVRIVGRQGGFYTKDREQLIKESIRKSSPDIIFLGLGFPQQEAWIRDNKEHLSRAVVFGVDGAFDILSGEQKKAPDWSQLRGLNWLWRTLTRPFLVHRLFYVAKFFCITYWRAFKLGRQAKKAAA